MIYKENYQALKVLAAKIAKELPFDFLLDYQKIKRNKSGFLSSIYSEDNNPSMKLIPGTNKLKDFSSGKVVNNIEFYRDYRRINFFRTVIELKEILDLYILSKKNIYTPQRKKDQKLTGI